jgi:hypothetical protein
LHARRKVVGDRPHFFAKEDSTIAGATPNPAE